MRVNTVAGRPTFRLCIDGQRGLPCAGTRGPSLRSYWYCTLLCESLLYTLGVCEPKLSGLSRCALSPRAVHPHDVRQGRAPRMKPHAASSARPAPAACPPLWPFASFVALQEATAVGRCGSSSNKGPLPWGWRCRVGGAGRHLAHAAQTRAFEPRAKRARAPRWRWHDRLKSEVPNPWDARHIAGSQDPSHVSIMINMTAGQ